jgi:uncharacterized caspase-like protein
MAVTSLARFSRLLLTATLALLSVACGRTGIQTTTRPTGPGAAEGFMIVDCLLPGQIRQLGGQVTYVTVRRAVKTSASDCEIRGGEYVAFDRANYATALKVWLPLAEQGDQAAQTYVGEIFEKGLGVQPDYAVAATWYRRAAERGYARAALNLGNLYERGLGVSRDPVQALSWYRRAGGAKEVTFEITPAAATTTAEVAQLRAEVGELRRDLEARDKELARTQGELSSARQALDGRRGEVEAERRRVEQLRRELDETRRRETNAGARASRVAELERTIAEHEAAAAAKNREMETLRASVVRLEGDTRDQRERLERLRQQTATGAAPVIQILQPELRTMRDGKGVRASVTTDRPLVVGRVVSETELVTFTVNDRAEKLLANNVFRTEVALARPEEPIRLAAVDRQGRRGSVEFVIARVAPAPTPGPGPESSVGLPRSGAVSFGKYHALVIGNNDYKQMRALKTAVADAREVARVLELDYGFQVRLLVNASRYEILAALNDMREKLTEKDNLLIYYAGHGELDERNQRGYWLPVDAEPNSTANWISNIAITDVLNSMTVQQLLVVADSCYAGTLTRSSVGRLEGGLSEGERTRLLSVMAKQRSRMVLTSGGVEPVLDSAGGVHSAFAQAFLGVLRSNVGLLPGQELFGHLRLRVASVADRVQMRQVPEYAPIKFAGHESGDFVFVRKD